MRNIIVLVLIIILSTGCSIENKILADNALPGTSVTLSDKDNNKIKETTNQKIYWHDSSEISFNLEILNRFPHIVNYSLIIVENNCQKEYTVNGSIYQKYTFDVNSNSSKKIPISLKKLKEGLNNLIFLVVKNDDLIEQSKNLEPALNKIICGNLFIAIKNNTQNNFIVENNHKEITCINKKIKGIFLVRNRDSVSPKGVEIITQQTIKRSNTFDLFFYRGLITSNLNQIHSILLFKNGLQEELTIEDCKYLYLADQTNQETSLIPMSIHNNVVGLHSYFAIMPVYMNNGENQYTCKIYISNIIALRVAA